MLQADIGRVNARAGEERRIIPERDEKTLMQVDGLIVGVTLRPSLSVSSRTILCTISRADVLNLTSAEAGHNHPKLYTKVLASMPRLKSPATAPGCLALKEKRALLRQKPHLLNVSFRVELPARRRARH